MSAPLTCDVLVVGAGPAGSALAAGLARGGMDVIIAEGRRLPRPKACAEYASPRIADELRRLGMAEDAWRPHAVALDAMRVIRGDDAVDIRYRDAAGPRTAWGVDRASWDAALFAHAIATGARPLERAVFEAVLRQGDRATGAVLRGPNGRVEVRSRWLVGADGARSRVAADLGVERRVRAPRRMGLVARYEASPELVAHGEMHVGRGWYVGLAPVPGGQLNVGMALPLERAAGSAWARWEASIARLPAVARRLAGLRRVSPIRGAAPIGHRVARSAGEGWLLIGDAAGFVDPFTGEGIYRALRSARAAADALLAESDVAAAYRRERRRAFAAKDALTWLIQVALVAGPGFGYAVRRLADRPALADVVGSALGDCRPASDSLSPRFLAALLRP